MQLTFGDAETLGQRKQTGARCSGKTRLRVDFCSRQIGHRPVR